MVARTRRSLPGSALLLLLQILFLVHVCNSQSEDVGAPMEKAEQEALYSVIQALVGTSWNGSGLYPDPCGWTPIQGVSCDYFNGTWYVTAMSIGPVFDNSLKCISDAKFSPQLFELKHLKSLSFYNCFTSVHKPMTIPSQNWEKIAGSLETLEFRSNEGLTGEIPTSIGQLVSLRSLVLVDNSLHGKLPSELSELVHLKRLALGGNKFSGPIPPSLGNNLGEILILDLSRNFLDGQIPSSVGRMGSLLKLDLSNNLLHGNLSKELGGLRNLTLLDLRNNNLTGGLPQFLEELVSIQHLLLSNNHLLGGDVAEFNWDKLQNLTTLDLANLSLTGSIPESITKMNMLRFLAVDNNQLNGRVPKKLAALPSLSALHLNGNNFSGELEFSEEFYQRMGRRFASWDNRNLCYTAGLMHAPYGVEQCKQGRELSIFDPESSDLVAGKGKPEQNSSKKNTLKIFWWAAVVQEMVLVFFLVLLL